MILEDCEKQRKYYQKNAESGICVKCGKRKADSGFKTCSVCREKARVRAAAKIAFYTDKGLCPNCGKEKDNPKYALCSSCYKKKKKYNELRRKGKKTKKKRKSNAQIRKGWAKAGLCTNCGERPAKEGHTECTICIFEKGFREERRKRREDVRLQREDKTRKT